MTQRIDCADGERRAQAVASAFAAVRRGDLVMIPTESVYALATDAFSMRGVAALREAKGYDADVPLPIMVGSRSTIAGIASRVSDDARSLMEAFWPGPLTLLLTPQPTLAWDHPEGAPLTVRMPMHPVALALLAATGPLVVTSANLPGLSAPTTVDDALSQVGDAAALALDAGPLALDPTPLMGNVGLPSSVVDTTVNPPRIVRTGALDVQTLRRHVPRVLAEEEPPTA
ncbi:MAG: threonylcarbamoyl-AMP synthase [Candidatus Nanopelagicales bacterium]|nr:threonylcarbamoyl-AMP synthase [Candidatus Nanopelagicales bacterium]